MEQDSDPNGRRAALRDGAALLGAVAVSADATAQGHAAKPTTAASGPVGMSDPRAAYPKPPFQKQQQPWPGLASKMVPRPDHGEASYRGSGRLAGRKALITGGDSGIGRAAAIAYAREGADVAFGYLPQEQEDANEVIKLIEAAGRKAFALPGDIRSSGSARAVRPRSSPSPGVSTATKCVRTAACNT